MQYINDQKKWAVVFSGGGGKGSYQAGFIYEILQRINESPIAYVGCSIGSLISVLCAVGKMEKFGTLKKIFRDNPLTIWSFIGYKEFWFGLPKLLIMRIVVGLLNVNMMVKLSKIITPSISRFNGAISSKVFRKWIDKNIDTSKLSASESYVHINTAWLQNNGDVLEHLFTIEPKAKFTEYVSHYLTCSMALPFLFQPHKFIDDGGDDLNCLDGGIVANLPINLIRSMGGVNKCLVVLSKPITEYNAFDPIDQRSILDLRSIYRWFLRQSENNKIDIYIIEPKSKLPSGLVPIFKKKQMQSFDIGLCEAKEFMENIDPYHIRYLQNKWNNTIYGPMLWANNIEFGPAGDYWMPWVSTRGNLIARMRPTA